jgi:hypothetical protein
LILSRPRLALLLAWSVLFSFLTACRSTQPSGGELTREECADLVRHVDRLQAGDPGVGRAMDVRLKSDIEGCLVRGTQRAYHCVQQAETAADLDACEPLMK